MPRRIKLPHALLAVSLALAGCVLSPVERSGGPGSVTIPNTNPVAIARASRTAFARYGFRQSRSAMPHWIAFDRPAGRTGEIMFGGIHAGDTAIRARLTMIPIAGTHDIRVMPTVLRVTDASSASFARETGMLFRSWSSQLRPVLREIQAQASNAGPR